MGHDAAQLLLHYRVHQQKGFRLSGRSFTPPLVKIIGNCCHLSVSAESIRTASQADGFIQLLIDYTKSGKWPKVNRHSPLWHYYNRRNTMTAVKGCLLTASRIVIPKSLRHRVLSALHKAHPGQIKMKMLARCFVYWPAMDSDIEKLVRTRPRCASVAKDPIVAEPQS
ncbi:hypothetical protein RB195_023006 [Necator americanus]|uniref:RNA-directed DNA polymerase n=1 Tax=Necator americanus TaxID=51031 RepID=A0ABR1EHH3_NECAM